MFNLIEKENVNVRRLLAGRVLTNIADSLFYMAILWFFKVRFNSPVILSLIFIADSSIDMLSFTLGPLIDRIYIKKMLKIVTVVQIVTSVIATLLFQAKSNNLVFVSNIRYFNGRLDFDLPCRRKNFASHRFENETN